MTFVHVLLAPELRSHARDRLLQALQALAGEWGLTWSAPRGVGEVADRTLGLAGARQDQLPVLLGAIRALEGVAAAEAGPEPLFRIVDPAATAASLEVDGFQLGAGQVGIVAGPCSVETEEALLPFAEELREAGATALRAGAYKPRTSPYHFPGLGEAGLEILAEVRRRTGLAIVTEVLDPRDAVDVAEVAQVLQIGSRSMGNHALIREAARTGRPVLIKRGMAATISEFLQSAEAAADAGARHILLCERGLRHFDRESRNLLDLGSVPLLRTRTHLPIVVDPSHGTGRADLVPAMMAAAVAAGADGLLVEVHPRPSESVSDAAQALSLPEFRDAVTRARSVAEAVGHRLASAAPSFSTPLESNHDTSSDPRR